MSIIQSVALLGASGQGPSADLGDTIEQGLRFRGDQSLHRSFSGTSNTYTFSFWTKISTSDDQLAYLFSAGSNDPSILKGQVTASGKFYNPPRSSTVASGDNRFRDPSAWYHVMYVSDNGTDSIYVNGELVSVPNTGSGNFNGQFVIGRNTQLSYVGASLNGYMAAWYAIDGQALDPTDFGKYNNDGVWVPQNYTGTYGTNGFHLTFDSSQTNGIGHDSSGNGNHFTATNFDTGDVALWSSMLYSTSASSPDFNTTTKSFTAAATFGFNGSTSGTFYVGPGNRWVWRPNTAIPNVTLIEVYTGSGNTHWVNESAVGDSTTGGTYNTVYSGSAITLSNLAGQYGSTGSGSSGFAALRINGVVYVDNTDNDVDFNDTPTSNYATFNSVLHPNNQTLSNANLTGSANSNYTSLTTQLPNYKYYWEATGSDYFYGISEIDAVRDSYLGSKSNQVGWYLDGNFWVNSSNQGALGTPYSTTDIAMQCYDPATGKYWVGINGTWHGSGDPANGTNPAYTVSASIRENMVPANNVSTGTASYNFGQMNFLYTIPTGFKALQTNNLPEPTIKNGKEYMNSVLWTGDGTNGRDISGLDFQPDLVWISRRDGNNNKNLYDSVRGVTKHLTPSYNYQEQTTANSLTAFNSDGFQVGTGASDNTSGFSMVAWCWKAGGTAVSNTDGTITSSVSADTDAGFSIVKWQRGTNTTATIGHGLNSPPEVIISKSIGVAENWSVYHVGAGNNGRLRLNDNTAFDTSSGSQYWNNTTPSSTVFTVGNGINTNQTNDMIAYCWHSVEGFSKMGSFSGNSSTDGVFVHTNFKPQWLLIKRSSAADHWACYDAARDTFNPVTKQLNPDLPSSASNGSESDSTNNAVDFLSNGFKLRTSDSRINGSGSTYIYMAFGSNPFGGENAPPATAR